MATEWAPATLAELIDIKHGFAFQGEFFRDEPGGDVLLTPGNFAIGGGFKSDKFKYYGGPVPEEFILREGDLLVTMTDLSKAGDTLGYPAIVPHNQSRRYLHNQRLGKINNRFPDKLDDRFLFYLLCSGPYRHEVLASATGSTVKHTSPSRICAHQFFLPPVAEQRAISGILGALDDKIELNCRLTETLEAMARALFQSWFEVGGVFNDSDVTGALQEICDINPARVLRKNQVAPYLDMASLPTRGHSVEEFIERPYGSGARFQNGDTLVARITPCLENGKTAFVDVLADGQVGWGSTEYIVLRPKPPLPPVYAYCLARSDEFRAAAIQAMTGSSGRQRVAIDAVANFEVTIPTEEAGKAFANQAVPLFDKARAAAEESRLLTAMRNVLLPKLISGDLRVGEV